MKDAKWFDERPRMSERCPRCKGCGTVDHPYALAPADFVHDAPNDAIRALVVGSFDIFTACREAADIARKSGEAVAFGFIDHCVVVKPDDNPVEVARQWWMKQYNETPEQTMARR